VTLGRFQPLEDIDEQYCEDSGIEVVHRYTGGRGVLHDDEVTYSVVASVDDGVPRGVAASYRFLCGGLVEAYRALGASAQLIERDRGHAGTGACYLQTTRADLASGDAKLSGSAQVWSGSTVLQHGSFVVSRDVVREAQVFRLGGEQARRLAEETATLHGLLGERPRRDRIVRAAADGFERSIGIVLVPGELGAHEAALAAHLLAQTGAGHHPNSGVRT